MLKRKIGKKKYKLKLKVTKNDREKGNHTKFKLQTSPKIRKLLEDELLQTTVQQSFG